MLLFDTLKMALVAQSFQRFAQPPGFPFSLLGSFLSAITSRPLPAHAMLPTCAVRRRSMMDRLMR
jgi:hypothetical protein